MNVLKWSKWLAPFRMREYSLSLWTVTLFAALLGGCTHSEKATSIPKQFPSFSYKPFLEKTLSKLCADQVVDIQYQLLTYKRSYIDKTILSILHLADHTKKEFVIKIFGKQRNTSQRTYVMKIYQLAGACGVGPKVAFSDTQRGILILEYIEGRHLTISDLHHKEILQKLAITLKKYHQVFETLPQEKASIQLEDRVFNRLHELNLDHALIHKIRTHIKQHTSSSKNITVVHSDLKLSNIILTPNQNIYIIDWSEAQPNNPILDLASLAHHSGMTNDHEDYLLKLYFGRPQTKSEQQAFYWYKNLSLLHTAAWALRESGLKGTFQDQTYDKQRLDLLLLRFYQDQDLSSNQLKEMGNDGILFFAENSLQTLKNKHI